MGMNFVLVFIFFTVHYLKYCMFEDSSTNYEILVMYVCVRKVHGKNLVERNHIVTEKLMSASQPMKNFNFGRWDNQGIWLCYVSTMASKPHNFIW